MAVGLVSASQPGQDCGRGKAVRNEPDRGLVVAHRGARLGAEPAVRLAGVEALAVQQFLHFAPLVARQHRLVARPRLHERLAAAQPVGEMADRQRIGLRRVVFHDDAEVVQHQEARPLIAGRHQQIGLLVRMRKRLAAGALDAVRFPFGERELLAAIGQQIVEALRDDDLVAPGLARNPAVLLQVVGGRGDQVGGVADDVAAAVAVEIDGVALERGRHELRRTERAGPGADQLLRLQVAAMQDFQRRQKFVAEIGLTAADAGERRGRAQHRPVAAERAVVRTRRPRSR